MLIAAFIFVISLATALQFIVLSWRAALLRVATEPLPAELAAVAGPLAKSFVSKGFASISAYSELCPDLKAADGPKVRTLRIYYHFLQMMQGLSSLVVPEGGAWIPREMALCTRCAAVMLSHRMEYNQELSAAARSF